MLPQIELDAIKARLPNYPIEAQADINRLLRVVETKQPTKKRTAGDVGYSPEFDALWKRYPKKNGKEDAYRTLNQRVGEGYDASVLIRCAELYLAEQQKKGTPTQYYLMLSSFYGVQKMRFKDYIERAQSNPKDEPDWCEPAQKLIRDMQSWERTKWGVPFPLPAHLDYAKGFGRA